MRLILVLALLGWASSLSADVVETVKRQTFEGVVVQFDDKLVRLNTGYGTLQFTRESQVVAMTMGDYDWPGDDTAPIRSEEFVKWAEAEASKRVVQIEIAAKTEDNELTGDDFAARYVKALNVSNDKKLSIKERADKLKEFDFSFAHLAAKVTTVTVEKDDLIKITFAKGPWYDSRTGKIAPLTHKDMTVWAKKGLNGKGLEEKQESDETYNLWIDYDIAETLKPESPVVFREGFTGENGKIEWTSTRATRFKPRKPLKDR